MDKNGQGRGRPSIWDPIFIDKVDEYLATCVDEEREFHKTRGDKSDSFERIVNVNLPKIEGFAQYIGVHKDTITEWKKKYDDFSVALDKIRTEQHNRLVDNGLSGRYNPVITRLILANNHGMREKSDVTTGGEKITVNTINYGNNPAVPVQSETVPASDTESVG